MDSLNLHAPSKRNAVVIKTPVILAPMAGVTNAAYRQLCLEQGAGLCVCEMITSRGLVYADSKTKAMLAFAPNEKIRSVQLYGVDPKPMAQAARILCEEYQVQHIDLNFGCPVPKITRKGHGGVLPWKINLMKAIVSATVKAADEFGVPVTIKTRIGIDKDHQTFLDSGRIAEECGCAAIGLHGRTVAQRYSGSADWDAIAQLVQAVSIPVLGNGDIWEAKDALKMVEHSGCAGVIIGRGCLGRPWLFRDLAAAFSQKPVPPLPSMGQVKQMVYRHAVLLTEIMGERHGLVDLRKHMSWYFKGFPVGGTLRHDLAMVSSIAQLNDLLERLDDDIAFPIEELGKPRGRQGGSSKVVMPYGWLDDRTGNGLVMEDELDVSGG